METTKPSATITNAERMKLIKWAKKNGAARISIDGVSVEFDRCVEVRPIQKWERDFNDAMEKDFGIPGQKPFYQEDKLNLTPEQEAKLAAWHADRTWPHKPSDSTERAVSAVRSKLEDPEAFARQTDAWANQTRLPR